jgi:hypothetical protein
MFSKYSAKNIDSDVVFELEQAARKKGEFVSSVDRALVKVASVKRELLEPSGNIFHDLIMLTAALRDRGFINEAMELEDKLFNYKKAESDLYKELETGEDLIDQAHPQGSVAICDPAKDDGHIVETIVDQHKKDVEVAQKDPNIKNILAAVMDALSLKAEGQGEPQSNANQDIVNGYFKDLNYDQKHDTGVKKILESLNLQSLKKIDADTVYFNGSLKSYLDNIGFFTSKQEEWNTFKSINTLTFYNILHAQGKVEGNNAKEKDALDVVSSMLKPLNDEIFKTFNNLSTVLNDAKAKFSETFTIDSPDSYIKPLSVLSDVYGKLKPILDNITAANKINKFNGYLYAIEMDNDGIINGLRVLVNNSIPIVKAGIEGMSGGKKEPVVAEFSSKLNSSIATLNVANGVWDNNIKALSDTGKKEEADKLANNKAKITSLIQIINSAINTNDENKALSILKDQVSKAINSQINSFDDVVSLSNNLLQITQGYRTASFNKYNFKKYAAIGDGFLSAQTGTPLTSTQTNAPSSDLLYKAPVADMSKPVGQAGMPQTPQTAPQAKQVARAPAKISPDQEEAVDTVKSMQQAINHFSSSMLAYINKNKDTLKIDYNNVRGLLVAMTRTGVGISGHGDDGMWGPNTQMALQYLRAVASSFDDTKKFYDAIEPTKKWLNGKYSDVKDVVNIAAQNTNVINNILETLGQATFANKSDNKEVGQKASGQELDRINKTFNGHGDIVVLDKHLIDLPSFNKFVKDVIGADDENLATQAYTTALSGLWERANKMWNDAKESGNKVLELTGQRYMSLVERLNRAFQKMMSPLTNKSIVPGRLFDAMSSSETAKTNETVSDKKTQTGEAAKEQTGDEGIGSSREAAMKEFPISQSININELKSFLNIFGDTERYHLDHKDLKYGIIELSDVRSVNDENSVRQLAEQFIQSQGEYDSGGIQYGLIQFLTNLRNAIVSARQGYENYFNKINKRVPNETFVNRISTEWSNNLVQAIREIRSVKGTS